MIRFKKYCATTHTSFYLHLSDEFCYICAMVHAWTSLIHLYAQVPLKILNFYVCLFCYLP